MGSEKTSLVRSFIIQSRVIGALLMREIITRYGRRNLGFLWLFLEPLLLTMVILLLWRVAKADRFSDINIVAFMLTGYPMAIMWRNVSNRSISAVSANTGLLYHRNVTVYDVLFSRMLLEIAGATIAQILIVAVLVLIDIILPPADLFYMIIAWLMMGLFAMALGLVVAAIATQFDVLGKIWGTLSFIMLPLSGAFFLLSSLPVGIREYFLWIPMVHGTEMFRSGYFGDRITTYESPGYLLIATLILLWFGLALTKRYSRGVDMR